ncbi:hypothetical protein [Saccharothrix hoggarensis]|uniref:Uncharacterized protein n=1 Tax=Saccharothrix hoggarensis TaxID=913853 RepID=A0ABW3QW75_9PSEU
MSDQETGVFTSHHVLDGTPVMRVYHDEDGDWQFMPLLDVSEEDGRLVGIDHLLAADPTLRELLDLPMGWYAFRDSVDEAWSREKMPEDMWS